MEWINIEETKEYPPANKAVWLYNSKEKCVWIGCSAYIPHEGFVWAISNGIIYQENGEIIAECEFEDIEVTHWYEFPKLPK